MYYTVEHAKKQVATMEALQRLEDNEDFKKVILDGYCKAQADVIVTLLAHSATKTQYEERCDKLLSISNFRDFLALIKLEGNQAKEALENPEVYSEMENQNE